MRKFEVYCGNKSMYFAAEIKRIKCLLINVKVNNENDVSLMACDPDNPLVKILV